MRPNVRLETTEILIKLIKIQNLDRGGKNHAFQKLRHVTSTDGNSYKNSYHSTSLIKEARS